MGRIFSKLRQLHNIIHDEHQKVSTTVTQLIILHKIVYITISSLIKNTNSYEKPLEY